MGPDTLFDAGRELANAGPYATVLGPVVVGLFLALLSGPRPVTTRIGEHPNEGQLESMEQSASEPAPVTTEVERRARRFRPCIIPNREMPLHSPCECEQICGDEQNLRERHPDVLRSILGSLAEDLTRERARCRPRVVQRSEEHVDLYLDRPTATAPNGWSVDADGAIWTSEPPDGVEDRSDLCAAPLLVALGRPDDGAQIHLDLEADGLISLVGDPNQARRLARQFVSDVALGPMADTTRVIVIGDVLDPPTTAFDHVVLVDTWEKVNADIVAWANQSHHALRANAWPNAFLGRGADPYNDALTPLLVVASSPPSTELLQDLASHRPAALALVIVGAVSGARCVIDCQPDRLHVVDIALTCSPRDSEGDEPSTGTQLLEPANSPSVGPTGAPALHVGLHCAHEPERSGLAVDSLLASNGNDGELVGCATPDDQNACEEPSYEILVRLLGEIRVEGGQPLRTKPTAVLAYIALHHSVSVEALEDACWAEGSSSGSLRKRLKDVMSECRAGVGAHHLPASAEGHYTVGAGVLTDTELFDLRVERATGQPLLQRAETYRSALDLVTGKVFTYPSRAVSSFGWIDTENLLSQWEVKVQRTAQQCIEAYRTLGEPERATRVAVHALRALPLNATLTEELMRAHAQMGDLGAIETVYRSHAGGLARIYDTDPEESTRMLHDKLCAARMR